MVDLDPCFGSLISVEHPTYTVYANTEILLIIRSSSFRDLDFPAPEQKSIHGPTYHKTLVFPGIKSDCMAHGNQFEHSFIVRTLVRAPDFVL